jgi:3-phenylpropionate/cinnamic acid dioxygenase small subunit
VGNVEVLGAEGDRTSVTSNFHLFYSRPGSANFLYAGQRRDVLLGRDGDYKFTHREIVINLADIEVPTLGPFL